MSLDVYLEVMQPVSVYDRNITHNLNKMASEAGIYMHLWSPDEMVPPLTEAWQLIEPLKAGLALLESDPVRFRKFDASNGWGRYEHLVEFVRDYISGCEANPEAAIRVRR
jgi:hypothetical protein